MELSERYAAALTYAANLHAKQTRKGTGIPYVAHLLAVSALVLEAGGNETTAIAALLHDALEDQGREGKTETEIRERFGADVLAIVKGCTDTEETPKPPWEARKKAYITHIVHAPPDVHLVSCADKLHNARAIVADLRVIGDALWSRFTGGKEGTLWYYESLSQAFAKTEVGPLAGELQRTVAEMRQLANDALADGRRSALKTRAQFIAELITSREAFEAFKREALEHAGRDERLTEQQIQAHWMALCEQFGFEP